MTKMLRFTLSTFFLIVLYVNVAAQDPAIFSQFLQNPFQFNPAYVANNGYTEANLFYRKQWMGIENAPVVAAFNIQAPVGRSVSLGLTVFSNKTVLLDNNGAFATFGYRLRVGYNHHLNFGMSAGMALNNLDPEAVANSNDPALSNVVLNSKHVTGQVGLSYQFKRFNVSFALPKLFQSDPVATETLEPVKFSSLTNKFGSVSYTASAGSLDITPTVLYRALDNRYDQWEGMLQATYKKMLWVGASYREGYGVTGFIGVRIKGLLRLGYAYEHPTTSISRAAVGSHEVYLGARIGKRDREHEIFAEKKKRDSVAQIAKAHNEIVKEEPVVTHNEEPVRPPVVPQQKVPEKIEEVIKAPEPVALPAEPVKSAEVNLKEAETQVDEAKNNTEKFRGYYVVLGVYRNPENATKQMSFLKSKGLKPNILYIKEKDYYYVYLFHSQSKEEAVKELHKTHQKNQFFAAWIFSQEMN